MIKKLAPYMKKYKTQLMLGVLCAALEAIFELLIPLVMAQIVDVGISNGNTTYTIKMGLLMLVMATISLSFGIGLSKFSAIAGQGFGAELRQAEYEKIQTYSFKNIEKFSTASLITRLTTDITMIQNALTMGIKLLVRAPMMLIVACILAVTISPKLAMIFLVSMPVLIISIGLIIKNVKPKFESMQKKIDNINRVVQENLIGIRVVKAYVREDREKDKFHNASDELAKQGSKASGLIITVMPVMMLLMNFVIIYIYYKGSVDASKELMNVGQISVLANYIIQVLMNIMMVSMLMLQITRAKACGDRVVEVLDTDVDIVNPNNAFKPTDPKGEIEFKNVSFGYNDGIDILSDISFKAKPGSIVGIIGSTGCGKSSLINLIPRLYDVTGGEILVDGVNVKNYDLEALRELTGVVLQKNVLFTGSIKENIKWGKKDATDEEIIAACKAAQAHEFIMSQPNGYDTVLAQGGLNLSGGQKQRLCIARAIIKQPKILILDDSTSAVDTATEAKIRECFYNELKDTTVLIIAQRISSVAEADEIIVLDDGKIDSIGTHDELMQTSKIYQEINKTQQKGVTE